MHCKNPYRRMRQRTPRPARAQQKPEITVLKPLPPGLVQQLACPLTDMTEVERLLAHLYCAKARGIY